MNGAHPRVARYGVDVWRELEGDRTRWLLAPLHRMERQDAHAGRLRKEDLGTRGRPLKGLVDVPYGGRLDVTERRRVALCTACADIDAP